MFIFEIIHTSTSRWGAIKRLQEAGYTREEAKMYTFGMDAIGKMQESIPTVAEHSSDAKPIKRVQSDPDAITSIVLINRDGSLTIR